MTKNFELKIQYSKLEIIFTALIILFPILFRYRSFINIDGITLADTLLIAILPFLFFRQTIIKKRDLKIICTPFLLYAVYIFCDLTLKIILAPSEDLFNLIMTTIRYLLYLIVLAFFLKQFFNLEFGKKFLKWTTLISSLYLITQEILYKYFKIFIPGDLSQFAIPSSYVELIRLRASQGHDFRFMAFFSEPSYFSVYVLICLSIELYHSKKSVNSYIIPLIISLSIFMSKSSTGIIMAFLIWFIWLLRHLIKSENLNKKIIFLSVLFVILPFIFYAILNSPSFEVFIARTFSSDGGMGRATQNRIGAINMIGFFDGFNIYEIFFGKGLLPLPLYYPGVIRVVYNFGLIGCIVFFIMILALYLKSVGFQKELVVIFMILNIGTETVFGCWVLLYFSFIITFTRQRAVQLK